jgi:hypothetical protein
MLVYHDNSGLHKEFPLQSGLGAGFTRFSIEQEEGLERLLEMKKSFP